MQVWPAQIDAEVRSIEQKKSEKQNGGKTEDPPFHGMNTILLPVLSLFFVPVPHTAPGPPSSNRMSTSSCHPDQRERKPFGFLPYSWKPTLLYRTRAFLFSATASSSSWTYPAVPAHSMQASVKARPIPRPQYALSTLMPNSARCRVFSLRATQVTPAEPTIAPSTNARISISSTLSVFLRSSSASSSTV